MGREANARRRLRWGSFGDEGPSGFDGTGRASWLVPGVAGVILGAYVAQKLRSPLGFETDNPGPLFLLFAVAVMAVIAVAVRVVTRLVASGRDRDARQENRS